MENFPSMNYYWYQNICLRWKEAKDIDQHFLLLKLTRLSNWFGGGALEFCLLWISSISWSLRQGLLLEFYKYHSTHISWVSRWINCENWSIPPLPFHISIAVLTTGDLLPKFLSSRKGKKEILKDTCSKEKWKHSFVFSSLPYSQKSFWKSLSFASFAICQKSSLPHPNFPLQTHSGTYDWKQNQ